ncbi:MAG: glycosyltransferase family 39 protein [Candidatus Omnitrophica bacterium]|nr:glycosyltransferase family 39 protein [Candidatus Omnitrophota bacterium]
MPYLAILLFSTYLIGSLIFSGFVGLLATFVLFMNPLIFTSSRQFQLDFPLTAMVALSILLFLKSNNFTNRKYSFFFGLSLGWTMLIKGQGMIFIICPLLWSFYKIFANRWKEILRTGQFQNIAIFILVAGLIASIWWGDQLKMARIDLYEHIFSKQKSIEANFSWNEKYSFTALSFYSRELLKSLGLFLFLAFIISFIFFLIRKIQHKGTILAWIIPPFLLFNFAFTVKHIRFLLPLMPAVALITAWGLGQIRNKILKIPILSVMLIYAPIQFYLLSYCPWNYREVSIGNLKIFGRLGFGTDYEAPPPHKEDFKVKEAVRIIREHALLNQPVKIGSISCESNPSNLEMLYYLRLEDRFIEPFDFTEMHKDFQENFNSLDFIVFHQPAQSSLKWPGGEQFIKLLKARHKERIAQLEQPYSRDQWERLLKILEEAEPDFQLVGKVFKDKGDSYYIYKRIHNVYAH